MARVVVGGTFDPLHDGHKALLMKACELSRKGELLIGLASDEMARNKPHSVVDYRSRYDEVKRFINAQGISPVIIRLDDPYGPTIHDDFDFLVVSPETLPVALKINMIRREKGLGEMSSYLSIMFLQMTACPSPARASKKEK